MEIHAVNANLPTSSSTEPPWLFFPLIDEEKWKIGYQAGNNFNKIMELVPKEETVHNWSEMITINAQTIPNFSVEGYYQEFIRQGSQRPGFQSSILQDTKDRILFEWKITEGSEKQFELTLITRRNDNYFVLHYVTKDMDYIDALKAKYLPMLEQADIR